MAKATGGSALCPIVYGRALSEEPGLGALTLGGYLREVTTRFAEREALVMHEDGDEIRWSYADLWDRAMQVARGLRAHGVGKDSRVGIMMTNRPEWLASVFGVALAGGVAVTLGTFSTSTELDYLLRSSAVSILLFEGKVLKKDFCEMLAELEPALRQSAPGKLVSQKYPFLRRLFMVGSTLPSGAIEAWDELLASAASIPAAVIDEAAAAVQPHELGAILYSSGSTALPKGILNTHRGMCIHFWRWPRMFGFAEDVRSWAPNGFFWSGNFATVLGATLSSGGCLVLQSAFDPVASLELLEKERVNYPVVWPHQAKQMQEAPNWGTVDLSAMKYVDFALPLGEHPKIHSTWSEPVCNYGSTETFTVTTCYPNSSPENIRGRSWGEVLAGNAMKIVDPETGKTLPRGSRGEIAVKGPTLMLGYLGIDPAQTFDADGFFRTGDGGYLDELGRLQWEGRLSDIIKTGGANVSPLEIDAVLEKCPGVKVARTIGVPHDTLGEIVIGCIVPEEGIVLDAATVRNFAKKSLASYKIPREILFLHEEELVLTGSAKIRSSELRKLASSRLSRECPSSN
ncbi:class I adenylate-forming enzyme family protein (plasmid) [Novosphingobium sp. BL-8A]|uniref:class I adenylate-forming enzyme family protein n=1 Tax=Novosphingobium sp. BL-8A TaxID=3127639 RepID=UPI0037575205